MFGSHIALAASALVFLLVILFSQVAHSFIKQEACGVHLTQLWPLYLQLTTGFQTGFLQLFKQNQQPDKNNSSLSARKVPANIQEIK